MDQVTVSTTCPVGPAANTPSGNVVDAPGASVTSSRLNVVSSDSSNDGFVGMPTTGFPDWVSDVMPTVPR